MKDLNSTTLQMKMMLTLKMKMSSMILTNAF